VGVMDALGIARAHVVGISLGGMIAQVMATRHAGRVTSLTSIMSSSGNRRVSLGKPVALLLLHRHATVTICHSRTRDLPALCREADVLVAAVGVAEMVRGDWVKPGATVIDVGMNRLDDRLCGDVAYDEVAQVAGALTPVPGGVGPMTIAFLLANTLQSAERRMGDEPTKGIIT
jgi:methylenetetrahydrofolate dehydrogenase (NADP+)/methenyltetrahydrofolate cyclohydrolase